MNGPPDRYRYSGVSSFNDYSDFACAGRSNLSSDLRKLDDDFDVVGSPLQCLFEIFRSFTASNEAAQPLPIRTSQNLRRLVPVPLIGVDAADNNVVLQHCRGRDISHGRPDRRTTRPDTRQTHDSAGAETPDRVIDDLPDPGALDDDIGRES